MKHDSNRPVRIAMVGLGWWGRKMVSVLERARDDISLVCAVEPDMAGAAAFCAEKGLRFAFALGTDATKCIKITLTSGG